MKPPQPPLKPRQRTARKNWNMENRGIQTHDYYGDKLRKKKTTVTRILLCNPNGLTGSGRHSKMEILKQKTLTYDIDALCMVEEGQNLKRIPITKRLRNATEGWWEHSRSTQSYNQHFDSGKESQVGGVSITVVNSLAHRSSEIEHDPTGLGRWTSMLIKGKQGFLTRLVCAYRPCKSSGPETAYMQHAIYYNKIGRTGDPRENFMQDLGDTILKWSHQGERLIVVGDFNTGDKKTSRTQQSFWIPWLKKTSLIDAHCSHIHSDSLPPSTHERGKVQIDFMFVSPGLTIRRAGFLPFSKFPGDHRALWVDIATNDIVGYKPPVITTASARKLKLLDPRVVQRYLQKLQISIKEKDFDTTVIYLSKITPSEWTHNDTNAYETLSQHLREAMIHAESKCRKFCTGKHPWSPAFKKARKEKFYWELTVKQLLGLHVPVKKLVKLKNIKNCCPSNINDITSSTNIMLLGSKRISPHKTSFLTITGFFSRTIS